MDPLFPQIPEDLSSLSDEDLARLEQEHRDAAALIDEDDADFLKGLSAEQVIDQYEAGVGQTERLVAEKAARSEAAENYAARKAELSSRLAPPVIEVSEEVLEVTAAEESEEPAPEGDVEEEKVEERELVLASAETETAANATATVRLMRPPTPSKEREPKEEPALVASLMPVGDFARNQTGPFDRKSLAEAVIKVATDYGPAPKHENGGGYRTGGDMIRLAKAEFPYPEDRVLDGNDDLNAEKIREVVVASIPGGVGGHSLTASGGLCAPLTPIYTMPNFATDAEPVWDALPKFQANRGGVNVPTATYIGDITTAISSISEANDALGGTYATKSCQDLTCPAYTETAVQILAHCREYGNLNARAWPEKIAHENELTMAALSRTSEDFLLEGIKALSVNVTNGVETLGALIYLVDAIVKAAFGIRGRLRMPAGARFRALLPAYALDLLLLDTIQTQFDRFQSKEQLNAYLRSTGIDPVYYIDGNFAAGDDQIPDAAQTAGALDGLPNTVQWALYPEGAFIGVDMGSLELGVVRDSTLNSTNDFQVFGEVFRNVARLAPAQACYWITTDWCPVGSFPPAGTARTCE